MQSNYKKSSAAALRSAERRQREDDAPRLKTAVPDLEKLQIAIREEYAIGVTEHLKHVVVGRAPALFVIPCGDAACQDGGHDVTHEIMHALRGHQTTAQGEHACEGMTGSAPCTRRLHFAVTATYTAR